MSDRPTDLKAQIADRIHAAPDDVWTPIDFLDLGSRDAVDKTLQRLAIIGQVRRLDRGLYDQPRRNPLTGQMSVPDYRRVIQAVARRDQTRMLVDGMTAANDLGLSDAVPGRIIVHTDARLRPIKLGKQTIAFRPTAPSKLFWAGRPAMRVVQALHWLHGSLADPDDRLRILRRLGAILADKDQGPAITADLTRGLPTLPAWMQDVVRELLVGHDGAAAADHHHQHEVPAVRRRVLPGDDAAGSPRRRRKESLGAPP
ncbi:MAG: DUF6088 family protein [Rhodopila sp.]|nr:DUF6088 family protein [Rhodopila sp.]